MDFSTAAAQAAAQRAGDRYVNGVWVNTARDDLSKIGVNTAGWSDEQVAAKAKEVFQQYVNVASSSLKTPIDFNLFGLSLSTWLLIVAGIFVISSRR